MLRPVHPSLYKLCLCFDSTSFVAKCCKANNLQEIPFLSWEENISGCSTSAYWTWLQNFDAICLFCHARIIWMVILNQQWNELATLGESLLVRPAPPDNSPWTFLPLSLSLLLSLLYFYFVSTVCGREWGSFVKDSLFQTDGAKQISGFQLDGYCRRFECVPASHLFATNSDWSEELIISYLEQASTSSIVVK